MSGEMLSAGMVNHLETSSGNNGLSDIQKSFTVSWRCDDMVGKGSAHNCKKSIYKVCLLQTNFT